MHSVTGQSSCARSQTVSGILPEVRLTVGPEPVLWSFPQLWMSKSLMDSRSAGRRELSRMEEPSRQHLPGPTNPDLDQVSVANAEAGRVSNNSVAPPAGRPFSLCTEPGTSSSREPLPPKFSSSLLSIPPQKNRAWASLTWQFLPAPHLGPRGAHVHTQRGDGEGGCCALSSGGCGGAGWAEQAWGCVGMQEDVASRSVPLTLLPPCVRVLAGAPGVSCQSKRMWPGFRWFCQSP